MKTKTGMKEFKEVLKHHSIDKIIEKGIKNTLEHPGVWSNNTEWSNFFWGFGNAWRDLYCKIIKKDIDIASNFPIGDVLTKKQLDYIAKRVGTTEKYKREKYT